jgi:hypothetical protein
MLQRLAILQNSLFDIYRFLCIVRSNRVTDKGRAKHYKRAKFNTFFCLYKKQKIDCPFYPDKVEKNVPTRVQIDLYVRIRI